MLKKSISAFLVILTLAFALSSCSLNENDDVTGSLPAAATSAAPQATKPEAFADNTPNYKFKNPVEAASTDNTYSFFVDCDNDEYTEYLQLVKQCGFTQSVEQSQTQYVATSADGYSASVIYDGTKLLVTFTKL